MGVVAASTIISYCFTIWKVWMLVAWHLIELTYRAWPNCEYVLINSCLFNQ
jgi:hypothetical protein